MDEARRLLSYIDDSPTPFHATANALQSLTGQGFRALQEDSEWQIAPGGAYVLTRGGSALLALRLPAGPIRRFRLIGAHTDSPNLRLKPRAGITRHGFRQLGVEVYGGALYNSWLDRDLGLAGRVTLRTETGFASELVRFDRPLCRIPQLAIHLDREVNEKGLILNPQQHLPPVIGLAQKSDTEVTDIVRALITEQLACRKEDIVSTDLMLYPLERAEVGGVDSEFLFGPRLDNLAMCFAATQALLAANPPKETAIGIALFDNEEVGSESARGAASPMLAHALERICGPDGRARYLSAIAESVFVSADMAHALHPNYTDRHDEDHHPRLNGGPVIKHNANQRYATDGTGAAWFSAIAAEAGVPIQDFVNRADLRCGTTIGPITAATLGLTVVDVGAAMLSMHSAREMAGSQDPSLMLRALTGALTSDLPLPTGW